jgi:phosphoribosylformylglycinamidine synthase
VFFFRWKLEPAATPPGEIPAGNFMSGKELIMASPRVIVLTGYGINCEEETLFAFQQAGAVGDIVHINDIIDDPRRLENAQIFAFPGGFSYGDDTGSGKALANKIRNNLLAEFQSFTARDTLMLGICNGFQVMANLGLVPNLSDGSGVADVSLEYNATNRYECRWVDLAPEAECPAVFTRGVGQLHIPVAHGEGRFFARAPILEEMERRHLVALRYVQTDGTPAGGEFPCNPNGSLHDIAAVCDPSGRRMGMMPHPERHIFFCQGDDWTLRREQARRRGEEPPQEGSGRAIFANAVRYYR